MARTCHSRRALLGAVAAFALARPALAASRFQATLDAFAASDRANASAPGSLLFVGSSTIRLWPNLAARFAPHAVIQRGFGGATLAEVLDARALLFTPHRPAAVILYAGENDIAEGATAEDVRTRFVDLRRLLADSPAGTAPWFTIAIKPSPARARLWPEMDRANALIEALDGIDAPTAIIDTASFVLDAEGRPSPDLFVADGLHFNDEGYRRLEQALAPALTNLQRL